MLLRDQERARPMAQAGRVARYRGRQHPTKAVIRPGALKGPLRARPSVCRVARGDERGGNIPNRCGGIRRDLDVTLRWSGIRLTDGGLQTHVPSPSRNAIWSATVCSFPFLFNAVGRNLEAGR